MILARGNPRLARACAGPGRSKMTKLTRFVCERVVRVSFGPSTSKAEVDRFAELWTAMAAKRRAA